MVSPAAIPAQQVEQQQASTQTLSVVSEPTDTTTSTTTAMKANQKKREGMSDEPTPVHDNKTSEEKTFNSWKIDTTKVETNVDGTAEASLEQKKKLRAERFGIPSKPSSASNTERDADDELLEKLEEEIKKAKRMGLPFKDLLKKKKEIVQRKAPQDTKQEDVSDKQEQRMKKNSTDKKKPGKEVASINNRVTPGNRENNQKVQSKSKTEVVQDRKRNGNGERDVSATSISPKKKQRVGQKVTKEQPVVDDLDSLPLPELQKRLDRAIKYNLEPAAVDKIKEAIMKKPINDLESMSKEELQKRLDRAEKFKMDQAAVDRIKAALRKVRFGGA